MFNLIYRISMKILKFNESVNEDIYSLIDQLADVNTLIEDDLIDFKDKGYSLSLKDDGDIILKGEYDDIYKNIQILNKLKGLNINLKDVKLTDSRFKYIIFNPKRGDISKKIINYFLKNLFFKKENGCINFRLGNLGLIELDIRENLSIFMEVGYTFYHSDIYQKSMFNNNDTFDGFPNKKEWESLITLVEDCIDYAKKNNIKI